MVNINVQTNRLCLSKPKHTRPICGIIYEFGNQKLNYYKYKNLFQLQKKIGDFTNDDSLGPRKRRQIPHLPGGTWLRCYGKDKMDYFEDIRYGNID